MKKTLLLTFFIICYLGPINAQVGIGTPMPNASSQLEVVAADKGVLIPKISLTGSTDATTISNGNVNSLLVFNTSTISDIKPGYYYWYDNKWNRIVISNEITTNPGTVIYNPTNQQFTYIDASGNTQIIDISSIVKANETITSLINNGAGSYTYTNEAGIAVNIDIVGDVTTNFSTIVNNPAVTNIIQDIVNKTEGNVTFDSTTNQFSYVDASGNTQIIDISTIVKANETITTLEKDAANNGQYTYTSENATKTTIDIVGDVINNANTILNNSTFINQLTNIIKANETLTSLTYDSTANTLTYIDEKAAPYTINLLDLVGDAETQTTLVYDQTAKTLTYNGESGTPTVINLVDLVGDAETVTTITPALTTGNTIATYNNEAGLSVDIKETVTTQSQDPVTGVITFTNETGVAVTSNVISSEPTNIITAGNDGGALLTPTAITSITTVSNTSTVNTATVTVNGVTSTGAPIINSNETALTGATLTTTVNGVASTALDLTPAITAGTTNALSLAGNTLTSNVNGVSTTSDAVSGVSNASTVNTSTVTVNGVTSTGAPIINSNATSITGTSLTTTVNGVASTALDLAPALAAGTTNTLTAVNGDLISTVNGVATAPVPIVISSDNGLTTVNGNVQLGGSLLTPTTIITDSANTLAITGLQAGTVNDNIVVSGTGGVLKTISSTALNVNDWHLLGNSGTNESVNFIGTTDDHDLVFKRDNNPAGLLNRNNTSFGVFALNIASTGTGNTAMGRYSLFSNTSGFYNTAMGENSLYNNTTGAENTASGHLALLDNTTGNFNTSSGYGSLSGNTSGNRNTAFGNGAGNNNTTASNNTFLGAGANLSASGLNVSNATAVGYNARVATSNSLVLGGSAADAVNVGIGIDTPTNTLHIKPLTGVNPVRIEGLQASLSGTDNIIVADATGILRTVTPSSLIPATTVSNTSIANSLSTTVNGVTGTAVPIINSNATSLTGTSLTTTVNGISSTALDLAPAIASGETTTNLSQDTATGVITYTNENADIQTAVLKSADAGNILAIGTDGGALLTPSGITAATTVSNASSANTSTVTVNGVTSTGAPIINSNVITTTNGILVSTVNGIATTPGVSVLSTADNGLTANNGNIKLGGTLTTPTVITTDVTNTLAIEGLQTGGITDNIVVSDATGILKTITPATLNANSWNIFGNTGTDASLNFLGTTDNVNLVFRRNNMPAGRIETDNTSFGVNALNIASTGIRNVALGTSTLPSNTSGESNTALGNFTLYSNTTGSNNTALGTYALSTNTIGDFNTATGLLAMQENASGNHNTTVGYSALASNQTGSNNTAVGSVAGGIGGFNGSGNTFIGNNANPTNSNPINNSTAIGNNSKVATSNSLVLGGMAADAVNVGIGIDAPTNTLHVKPLTGINPVRVEGLQPSVSGTDNVVVADATGVLKTVTASSLVPATTVVNTSAGNDLSTTVNGVAGTAVPIINSNATSLTGTSLTTTVNGLASAALDLTPAIKASETLTTINPIVTTGNIIATYTNEAGGTPVEVKETVTSLKDVVTQITDPFGQLFDLHTLTYTDETNTPNPIDLSVLVKGVETLTSLVYDGANHSLIYSDEHGNATEFKMVDLIGESETLTNLQVNATTGTLDYTDENKILTQLDLGAAVKEPWYSTTTHTGATLNSEDIYTNGWVGIGYTTSSTAPNEKLRVNGAISTVNTYYADYVFEDYFKGKSEIKADYKFKRLPEIEDYIKKHKHLPGITPINKLEKTKEGYAFNMSELSIQLLEKTEEIYLHIIEQNKEIEAKDKEIKELKEASKAMNLRLERLEKLITEKNN
ncbi:beta strand repeat-containing protein [Flavobacterium humidisoli]|uniref:Peptidase S74 domain-containing protein n=1 Tax=Flavobacterium humidisoli TaxID=2937442 RepID=A0ABY4LRZ6_9FLAO|nr:hypothetical protein [Flavobacterium humidisoli]UPZ14381.1 hypothetical protein M0M44_16630 [Flavobacterium humidisoli]